MIRRLALLAALCAGSAACGDRQLAQLEAIRTEACACKTPACAAAAMDKLPRTDVRSDHRAQGIAREIVACVAKLDAAAKEAAEAAENPDALGSGNGGSATRP